MVSLGCAKNLVDTERLLGRLASSGALVGAPESDADVVIVNTCGFIDPAKQESMETIREYLDLKSKRPEMRLLVMGCLVERSRAELQAALPDVDGFFGIHEQAAVAAACGFPTEPEDPGRLLLTPPHTAYLQVSDGCDHHCTYCTIPSIRGPLRSRPFDSVIAEAEELVKHGAVELNLIGQDTTSYGMDLSPRIAIDRLVGRLSGLEDLRWMRLLYAHPARISADLIEAYASLPKLVPYLDLPLQHMSDGVLRRMGRPVTRDASLALIDRLRDRIPGIALRTTFIVGFPGETEADFEILLQDVERVRFDHMGAFIFSPEVGTPAAGFPDRIPNEVAEERLERLMLLQQDLLASAWRSRVGEVVQVLVDGPAEEAGWWIGRTAGQAPDVDPVTRIRAEWLERGRFITATITGLDGYDLLAVPS
jgi:ribosomal protein S12 methylthiotransferase